MLVEVKPILNGRSIWKIISVVVGMAVWRIALRCASLRIVLLLSFPDLAMQKACSREDSNDVRVHKITKTDLSSAEELSKLLRRRRNSLSRLMIRHLIGISTRA